MYAPNDTVTLNIMVPYSKNRMNHIVSNGAEFETTSDGISDISIGGIMSLSSRHVDGETPVQHRLLANLSLGLPTGDDDHRGDTLMGNVKLPYPMQIGSGTYNLMPGITYLGQQVDGNYSWGHKWVQ